ncbi:MAG: Mur ligase domain-containing protein, partial [Actinomycetota bacterium]
MKPLPVDVLATAMNASVNAALDAALDATEIQATGVAIDSRDITPGDVFCALEGERVDGHDFAAEAIAADAGAINSNRDISGVPSLVTQNSLEARGRLS